MHQSHVTTTIFAGCCKTVRNMSFRPSVLVLAFVAVGAGIGWSLRNLVVAAAPPSFLVASTGAYYAKNDDTQHVIVATKEGGVHELYFKPAQGVHQDELACFDDLRAVSGYYAANDDLQHVIVATSDGNVYELYFKPAQGVHEDVLHQFNSAAVAVAGYYSPDDDMQHVIVATADRSVHELYFKPAQGVHEDVLHQFTSAVVGVAGYFAPDDKMQHVIVATADGDVHELYFKPAQGVHEDVLHQFTSGVVGVGGYYSPDDNMQHVVVATNDRNVHELYFRPAQGVHEDVLRQFSTGVLGVAGYFAPDDNMQHVMVATDDGNVHELYFKPAQGVHEDILAQLIPSKPVVQDVSPDTPNGTVTPGPSTAGLTVNLAGDSASLYAVSLDAGIWKSLAGGPWVRLANSPRYAYTIAVDPNNTFHLAVGERGGDAVDPHKDGAGLWESLDAGGTWAYTFDPLSVVGCTSEAIPAVAFSSASTLFIGTSCGIGRKPANSASFDFKSGPNGIGLVTAIAASDNKVWARTQSQLFFSIDDGRNWTPKNIPPALNGLAISFPYGERDTFSLGGFDFSAYMSCCSDPTPPCGNTNRLLIYNVNTDNWVLQPNPLDSKGSPQFGCDGTGLGGSRFVKTFSLKNPNLPNTVGQRLRLFYGAAQAVYEAEGLNNDGTISSWTMPVGATCPGCSDQDPVHSDIWDFLIAPDGAAEWLSGDGGVYARSLIPPTRWTSHIAGLHTHHIHTLTALHSGHILRSRLAYPTSDNDAWFWDAVTGWGHESSMGDVNWTAGDSANPSIALLVRRTGTGKYAMLTGFGANLPSGGPLQSIELNNDISRDGPQFFNYIQSLSNENPPPFTLDAVMLTNLPLQYADAAGQLKNVPGPLGQAVPLGSQNPVILRNTQFVTNADIDVSKGQGWQPAANNLPAGVQGFWVSGGHAHPIFYVYAVQSGQPKLFKGSGLPPPNLTQWEELNVQGNVLQPKPFPPSGMLTGGMNGPAFVNPYNPYQIYALTGTGVQVSTDGGFSFQQDTILTSLLTGDGKYPLVGAFAGGNGAGVRIASRGVGVGTLADMGFYRNNPNVAVAASPFTGVFYKDSSGKWHDLGQFLPRPFSPVSAVRMDCDAIYVATEGQSVMRITGYRNAP